MSTTRQPPGSPAVPVLTVRTEDGRPFRFSRPFQIGRDRNCDVRVEDARVSRQHATVAFWDGRWQLRDEQSGNGVFVDGRRVKAAAIDTSLTIRLGPDGPRLVMQVERSEALMHGTPEPQGSARETVLVAHYAERYFDAADNDGPAGPRTMMIRKAFRNVQKRQRRLFGGIIALLALIALSASGYAYFARRQLLMQQAAAQDLFYLMKEEDVRIADLELRIATHGSAQDQEQVKSHVAQRREMEAKYDQFLSGLKLYDHPLTQKEQLILRVTRRFGECEVAAPPSYLAEVGSYIRTWQATTKYAKAVRHAQERGYVKKIAEEFEKQDLPAQFFYLALVESEFDEFASGRPTRMGIAKGMWQFIPRTAKQYGLKIGPLEAYPRPDPADDRHNWEKATPAAARYIKDIYSTDAQASGLLVMASYNWGEHRVIDLINTMPRDPKERNFWKLLALYRDRVPKETYDYVLQIVAAATIGEDPRLFNFDFDNPLTFGAR